MYYDKRVIYASEETFNKSMKTRGLIVESENEEGEKVLEIQPPLVALVRGIICYSVKPEYDEEGNVTTEGVLEEGYHCDMRLTEDIDFGAKEVTPINPAHNFL